VRELIAGLDGEVKSAYLARLGLEPEPPSVEALYRLVHRHVERVPYETLWIHSREIWGIDPGRAAARIALEGRGGYCYHLNGALGALLDSLGYEVHVHVGGVHGPGGFNTETMGNHMVLTVSGLASGENPSGIWYVDTGLGDALYDPLPLSPGTFEQVPFHLSLEQTDTGWHLTHDPSGGFKGMGWSTGEAKPSDFEAMHQWLCTSPESGFVQVAMAERRDATGVDVIRGLVLSRIGSDASSAQPVADRKQWFAVLSDTFELRFETSDPALLDRLWNSVLTAHREWENQQS
jgi:N-hydroxyarylamine O-acetyltransferase